MTLPEKSVAHLLWQIIMTIISILVAILLMLILILLRDLVKSLIQFRRNFGHGPTPASPAYGVVVASVEGSNNGNVMVDTRVIDSDGYDNIKMNKWRPLIHDELESLLSNDNNIHLPHTFKCYRNDTIIQKKMLNIAQRHTPLRILIIGDSIARGVGCTSCTPVLAERLATKLSQKLGGRSVFWTVFAESGANSNWIAEQVEKQRSIAACNEHGLDKILRLEDLFASFMDNSDDDSANDLKDSKEKWVRLLQHHKKLHTTTPFSEYDIVVTSYGCNDLKRALLPFITYNDPHENRSSTTNDNGECGTLSGFQATIRKILTGLELVPMNSPLKSEIKRLENNAQRILDNLEHTPMNMERNGYCCHLLSRQQRQPLVVMPSNAVRLTPKHCLGTTISRALMIRVVDLMNQQKIEIIKQYHSADVLFIKEPTEHDMFIQDDTHVLLNLVAISSKERNEMERKMRHFYARFPADEPIFSADLIHLNDYGYKQAGHYIGREMIKHLHGIKKSQQ